MRYLRFDNGDEMPALGLGTWKSSPGEVGDTIAKALEIGYRHFDCAKIYGNEAEIGDAFQRSFTGGIVGRDDLWITSKLWCNAHRAEDVRPALESTLSDLKLDHLDLYLVHWPVAVKPHVLGPASGADFLSLEEVPLAETWHAMEDLHEAGLAKHIGVSNYSAKKLRAHEGMKRPPEVDQVELHPYLQQRELVAHANQSGIKMTGYSPLGSKDRPDGLKAADEPVVLEDQTVCAIANELDVTPAQVLLAWALQRGTCVIPKSTNPKRLAENFAAASIELPSDAMARIESIDKHRRYITGAFWAKDGSPYTVEDLWDEPALTG